MIFKKIVKKILNYIRFHIFFKSKSFHIIRLSQWYFYDNIFVPNVNYCCTVPTLFNGKCVSIKRAFLLRIYFNTAIIVIITYLEV